MQKRKAILTSILFALYLVFEGTIYFHDEILPQQYTHEYVYVNVVRGDTIWDICTKYYDRQDRYIDIREFEYETRKNNGFFSGRKQYLEEGDCIKITLDSRVDRRWNDVLRGKDRRGSKT